MNIMDFANDDSYRSSWKSNPTVKQPWFEITFKKEVPFNTIVIAEEKSNINKYELDFWNGVEWKSLFRGENASKIKLHRFERVWGNKVRIRIDGYKDTPSIAEFQVFDERRKS